MILTFEKLQNFGVDKFGVRAAFICFHLVNFRHVKMYFISRLLQSKVTSSLETNTLRVLCVIIVKVYYGVSVFKDCNAKVREIHISLFTYFTGKYSHVLIFFVMTALRMLLH